MRTFGASSPSDTVRLFHKGIDGKSPIAKVGDVDCSLGAFGCGGCIWVSAVLAAVSEYDEGLLPGLINNLRTDGDKTKLSETGEYEVELFD